MIATRHQAVDHRPAQMKTTANSRVILITGVTTGLGRALTAELARLGHRIAGCGRRPELLLELQASCAGDHTFSEVDVSSDQQVRSWAEQIERSFGQPDLILNNAAVINPNAPLWMVPAHEFDRVVDINLKGVANVIRSFVPGMIRRRSGVIVNFSSGWGRSTDAEVAPYCATKWAIEGLTQALAQELPAGMAAAALNPGIINTAMLRSCFGAAAAAYPSPADWAKRAAPFLLRIGPADNGKPLTAPGAA
jgi:NAD(P)-dependent dehydrogenase (short-subunit alcohol dehydrogenase family)